MSKRVMGIATILVFGLLASFGLASAQDTMKHDSMKKDSAKTMTALSSSDKKFIMESAHGGMMEVELGRLAVEKASSEDVKQFGQRMVDDHSKAGDELKQLADQKGVALTHDHHDMMKGQAVKDKLSKLSGADFDREYMSMMVKDHVKDVKEFEDASAKAKDPDLKAWATKTLPTLREHLQMARDVNGKVAGSKKMSGSN